MTQHRSSSLILISIFHFLVAAIALACIIFPAIYLIVGISMEVNYQTYEPVTNGLLTLPLANGQTFTLTNSSLPLFGGLILLMFLLLVYAICMVLAGIFLLLKKNYNFCRFISFVSIAFPVIGTILGLVTLKTIVKSSVRANFVDQSL